MIKYKSKRRGNSSILNYGLFFLFLIFMIFAIQVYFNYYVIIENIDQTKDDIISTQQKNMFIKNFYKPYLVSDDAKKFFSHENNILMSGEFIVKFTKLPTIPVHTTGMNFSGKVVGVSSGRTPQQSRYHYLSEKMNHNKW